MRFNGTATPEQLAILSQVFDGFCLKHAITAELEREHVSELVIGAFASGATTADDLTAAVEQMMASAFRRQPSAS